MSERLYRASSLYRRFMCPGSARMERGRPEETSKEAESGTRVHRYVMWHEAMGGGNEVVVAGEEEKEFGDKYISFVDEYFEGCDKRYSERYVALLDKNGEILRDEDGDPVSDGTVDSLAIFSTEDDVHIKVADLKTGWIDLDERAVSFQASCYLAFAMQEAGAATGEADFYHVRFERHYRVEMTAEQIHKFAGQIQLMREHGVDSKAINLVPSQEACRYCKAKVDCPAVQAISTDLQRPTTYDLAHMEDLERDWGLWKILKKRGEKLEDLFKDAVRQGQIPAYEMHSVQGRRYLKSVLDVYSTVSHLMSKETFMQACSVNFSKLKEAAILHMKNVKSKAAAERRFEELVMAHTDRGKGHEQTRKVKR